MQLLGKLLGDPNKKEIKSIQPIIDKINALEPEMEQLSDEQLAEVRRRRAESNPNRISFEDVFKRFHTRGA